MFVLRSTHDRAMAAKDAGYQIIIRQRDRHIAQLQAELANKPVRGARGRFAKRGE
jgi:hypothetical protein